MLVMAKKLLLLDPVTVLGVLAAILHAYVGRAPVISQHVGGHRHQVLLLQNVVDEQADHVAVHDLVRRVVPSSD